MAGEGVKRQPRARIEGRTVLLIGAIMVLIILIYTLVLFRRYDSYEQAAVGRESLNTMHSIDSSLYALIERADQYSRLFLADPGIQRQMERNSLFTDVTGQREVIEKLYSVLQFEEAVDAIWLIDRDGRKLSVGGSAQVQAGTGAEDFAYLQKPYGSASLIVRGEGSARRLMLVRSYNSLDTFHPLGLIGVDIRLSALDALVSGSLDLEREHLLMLRGEGDILYERGIRLSAQTRGQTVKEVRSQIGLTQEGQYLAWTRLQGERYLVTGIRSQDGRGLLIRISRGLESQNLRTILRFDLLLIVIFGAVIFMTFARMSSLLTRPVGRLLAAMKEAERGNLVRIPERSEIRELGSLFRGYNRMIDRINELFRETMDRQRRIRQVELNEIQEQMKPHFLYNTLDSIEALAMMGDTENVSRLIEALGAFYRKSVSGGKEFLTVREELQIVEEYARIMNIRFGDSFRIEVRCGDGCEGCLIPKLTIQPLVENSFQHGIRHREKYGVIQVSCFEQNGVIHIRVEDNGDGIGEEVLRQLEEGKEPMEGKSLGLRGTIERLRLLYGEHFCYSIDCADGTKIDLAVDRSAADRMSGEEE